MPVSLFAHLLSKVEGSRNSNYICSRHAAAYLLTELSDIRAGGFQVLQKDDEARALLTCGQERPQTSHLHCHAVQGTLGKLKVGGRHG